MKFLLLFIALSTLLHALPQESDLVALWDFEGNADNNAPNTTTLNGTLIDDAQTENTTDPINNSYLRLDGDGDYVDIGEDAFFDDLNTEWSASVWFRADAAPGNNDRFFIFETAPTNFSISLGLRQGSNNNNETNIQVFTSSSQFIDIQVPDAQITSWNHVLITYSNTTNAGGTRTLTAYLNGVQQPPVTITADISPADGFHIGTFRSANGRWFNGSIDEVALWDVALTQEDALEFNNSNLVVTNNRDDESFGSLRNVLSIALGSSDNNTITFDPSLDGQTITLSSSGQLTIPSDINLTMDASNLPNGIIIDANATVSDRRRVLEIEANSTVNINNITFTGGWTADGEDFLLINGRSDQGDNGGGILNSGTLTLNTCTIRDNRTGDGGRGVSVAALGGSGGGIHNSGNLIVNACTINGNLTGDGAPGGISGSNGGIGGGIYNNATLILTTSTISGNSTGKGGVGTFVPGNGGGVAGVYSEGTLNVDACTISGNYTGEGGVISTTNTGFRGNVGGIGVAPLSVLTITNSIIAGNRGNDSQQPGGSEDQLNDFIDTSDGNNFVAENAMLTPLGDYGGPTQTMYPLPGSPAINPSTGSSSMGGTDQRGFLRQVNGGNVDIGAVEAGQVIIVTNTSDNGADSLRNAISNIQLNSNAISNGAIIGFDPSLDNQTINLSSRQLLIPSGIPHVGIDASNLPNGITINANATESNRRRVLKVEENSSTVNINNITFTGGKTTDAFDDGIEDGLDDEGGGGILNKGVLALTNCTITNNSTGTTPPRGPNTLNIEGGGGILNKGTLSLTKCTITNNSTADGINNDGGVGTNSREGAGISSLGESLTLTECSITNNSTGDGGTGAVARDSGHGAGIFCNNPLKITACTISNNSTGNGGGDRSTDIGGFGGDGGGIFCSSTLEITASTISNNSVGDGGPGRRGGGADGSGGGIFCNNITITSSTICHNNSSYIHALGDITMKACTISANSGGLSASSGSIVNSIIVNNGTGDEASLTSSSSLIGGNALLSPLGDYGGPTQTMLPLPGSPAIDAGSFSLKDSDQRGFRISDGSPDIGAVEIQGDEAIGLLSGLWNTDDDNDGIPFGLEYVLGLNPDIKDANSPRNLTIEFINDANDSLLTFGKGNNLPAGITLSISRSTNLMTYQELGVYTSTDENLSVNSSEADNTFTEVTEGTDSFFNFTDISAPTSKAFYRLEAEYNQPE